MDKSERKEPSHSFTIGKSQKDTKLIEAILQYQRDAKLSSGAEAVRDLCQYALEIKKVR